MCSTRGGHFHSKVIGQTNVDKVKVDDNKMKVEVKENEVRTKNNEKGKKDIDRKLDDDKRDKPLVIVAGDSMLRDINGWMMSRSNKVKVHSFSGANTSDMTHFLQPLMKKKPDHVLIHIGTNDLCDTLLSPDDIARNVVNLVKSVTSEGIKCSVSSLIQRNDELWEKGQKVNVALKRILPDQCSFIDNSNINTSHLNRSGLHLNKRGSAALALNFINFIRNLDLKNQPV